MTWAAPWLSAILTAVSLAFNLLFALLAWRARADIAELKLWVMELISEDRDRLARIETLVGIYDFHRDHPPTKRKAFP